MMIPAVIDINPTELCNRVCSFCPRSSGYENRNLNLSIEDTRIIKKRIDECGFNGPVYLCGHGEPVLNRDIWEICNILKSNNTKIILMTNGDSILRDKFDWEAPDEVIISIYEEENYKKFKNIIPPNKKVELREQWKEENMNNAAGWFDPKNLDSKCFYPFYKLYINWNLDIHLCCHDWTDLIIGNIRDKSIEEVWNGPEVEKYRDLLHQGRRCDISACANCDINGTKMGGELYKEWLG